MVYPCISKVYSPMTLLFSVRRGRRAGGGRLAGKQGSVDVRRWLLGYEAREIYQGYIYTYVYIYICIVALQLYIYNYSLLDILLCSYTTLYNYTTIYI